MCMEQYTKHREEMTARGRKEPLGEGVLIVDEVKVYVIAFPYVHLK